MTEATEEQKKFRADLLARYGARVYHVAEHLSGLTTCIKALGCDTLNQQEREAAIGQACMHTSKLLGGLITVHESELVQECARRIDTAVELWAADAIENREGLPPARL